MCVEESDLQTVSYVHRMNVDELGLQQHELGYVTIYAWTSVSVTSFHCSRSHFILCVGTYQHKVFYDFSFNSAGYNGVWLRQKGTDSSGSCIPYTRRGQTSSAATQAQTYKLHTAGEKTLKVNYTVCKM